MAKDKKNKKNKKSKLTAKKADRHLLYQLSVQNVEHEEEFLTEVFKNLCDRKPLSLREDFCGTANASCQWVKKGEGRQAVGLDLDEEVLAWGQKHNVDALGADADRVKLMPKNVMTVTRRKFDIVAAMNFSYFIFKKRELLLKYFDCVRKSLVKDGIFALDCYGGSEAQVVTEEKRWVDDSFIYIWDQAAYNPIDNAVLNHIHFAFAKGPRMEKAFTYDWRLWTPREITDLLQEVGFEKVDVYWEEEDENEEGTGEYLPQKEAMNQEGWIAYIVAAK